jgi:hypothetical protein
MTAFADLLDLQTAVIERVKNVSIADVFPQLVKLAEASFNRRLRCREQMTTASVVITSGTATLPTDFEEIVGVYDSSGYEFINQPVQSLQQVQTRGYYAISGSSILAKNDETLTLQYYAKLPTITDSMTDSNWLLQRHPGLYLYGVAFEAAKHLANPELAQAVGPILELEYQAVDAADASGRYARARVRVQGPTP